MSELITADNLDVVVEKNREIRDEITKKVKILKTNRSIIKTTSISQLALLILEDFGLIQMPVEDKFWSGAIFVKDGKIVPVINTALPRANQYFTAWHEVYHLLFDTVSFDHFIETDNILEERKAECFAASVLLNGVERYYAELSDMEFISKIFCCMSAFQAPYKSVLVSLYEYSIQNSNNELRKMIKKVFDIRFENMPEQFRKLGLDDSLVIPSYVVNTSFLQRKIHQSRAHHPELKYHDDNEEFLKNIKKEIMMLF